MGMFGKTLDNDFGMITESFMQEYNEKVFFVEASMLSDSERSRLFQDMISSTRL